MKKFNFCTCEIQKMPPFSTLWESKAYHHACSLTITITIIIVSHQELYKSSDRRYQRLGCGCEERCCRPGLLSRR